MPKSLEKSFVKVTAGRKSIGHTGSSFLLQYININHGAHTYISKVNQAVLTDIQTGAFLRWHNLHSQCCFFYMKIKFVCYFIAMGKLKH